MSAKQVVWFTSLSQVADDLLRVRSAATVDYQCLFSRQLLEFLIYARDILVSYMS